MSLDQPPGPSAGEGLVGDGKGLGYIQNEMVVEERRGLTCVSERSFRLPSGEHGAGSGGGQSRSGKPFGGYQDDSRQTGPAHLDSACTFPGRTDKIC